MDAASAAVPPLVYRAPRKRPRVPTLGRWQGWLGRHYCSNGGLRGSAQKYRGQRGSRPTQWGLLPT
eukprot:6432125-Pyramimonas_sp.AAC.2